MRDALIAAVVACVIGAGFLFVAIFDDEMYRRRFVLNYTKGVYQGRPDQVLSETDLAALRGRAAYQAAAEKVDTSVAGVGLTSTAARPPGGPIEGGRATRETPPY